MQKSGWLTGAIILSCVAGASAQEVRLSDAQLDWIVAGQWASNITSFDPPDLGVWTRNPVFSPLPNTPEARVPGNQLQFWPYLGTPFLDTQIRSAVCLDAPGFRCGAPYDAPVPQVVP